MRATKAHWRTEVQLYFSTSVRHGGEQSTSRPSCCNPGERPSRTSCAPEPAWKLRKKKILASTGNRNRISDAVHKPTELTWLKRFGAIFMSNEICLAISFFLLVILRRCNSVHTASNGGLILDVIQRK